MKQKYYVELNRQEWQLIIEGLNRYFNSSRVPHANENYSMSL